MGETPIALSEVLRAPIAAIRQPTSAAGIFIRCPLPSFLLVLFLQAMLLGAALALVYVGNLCFDPYTGEWFSMAEARRRMNNGAAFGPCEAIVAVGFFGGLMLPFMFSLFYLPRTLRCGSAAAAIGRGYRAAAVTIFAAAGIGGLLLGGFAASVRFEEWSAGSSTDPDVQLTPFLILGLLAGVIWFISRVERAIVAAAEIAIPEIPPRCEGCGYDLSHQSASGLCTECNEPVSSSLTPGIRRVGVDWAKATHSAAAWLRSSFELLVSPQRFYSNLRVRQGEETSRQFCRMHYRFIAFVAAIWFGTMLIVMNLLHMVGMDSTIDAVRGFAICVSVLLAVGQGTPLGRFQKWRRTHGLYLLLPVILYIAASGGGISWSRSMQESALLPLIFGVCAALGCWFGHRLAAFIILVLPMRARMLVDFRWAEQIVCYEAVFLWVFCVTWGVLVTSIMVFGAWMSDLRAFDGLRRATGMIAEPASLITATLGISVIWIWRYRIALRAIRWNNF